jgi:RNA polymerase sigma-70 factor (ECF subfamily)
MKHTSTQEVSQFQGGLAALPPTRWTVVAKAGDRDMETWAGALQSITLLYRPVLVRHVISRLQVPPDRAEDLVQAFLHEKLLDQNVLRQASPQKGRFRSFLLKVFSNFVRDRLREQQAYKRRPSSPDVARLEDLPELPSGEALLADSFDVLWARQVLARTVERIREECHTRERQALWGVLEARILGPVFGDAPLMPYETLVAQFGLRSPSEASNLLITAKRMFARVLREVVRETVADEAEVEAEIMELKRILSK